MSDREHAGGRDTHQPVSQIAITTTGGHSIVLDDDAQTVTVSHSGGTSIVLTGSSAHILGTVDVTISAPTVRVASPMVSFDGVVECDTLIAQSVVGSSYTPGAGNIW